MLQPYQQYNPYPRHIAGGYPNMSGRQVIPMQQAAAMNQMLYMPQQGMSQMMPMQMQQPQQKKGILSKLFGRKNDMQHMLQGMPVQHTMNRQSGMASPQSGMMNPQSGMASPPAQMQRGGTEALRMIPATQAVAGTAAQGTGGIGSFFSNVLSNPSAMLGNMEKIVQVAQKVGPVVQQYGPLVRSFPSIMKILNSSSEGDSTSAGIEETAPAKKERKPKASAKQEAAEVPVDTAAEPPTKQDTPKPKLYV